MDEQIRRRRGGSPSGGTTANIAKGFIWRLCIARLELKAAMRLCHD